MLKKYYSVLLMAVATYTCVANTQHGYNFDDMTMMVNCANHAAVTFQTTNKSANDYAYNVTVKDTLQATVRNQPGTPPTKFSKRRRQILQPKQTQVDCIPVLNETKSTTKQYAPKVVRRFQDEQTTITIATPIVEPVINFNRTDSTACDTLYEIKVEDAPAVQAETVSTEVPAVDEKEANVQQVIVTEVAVVNVVNQPQVEKTTKVDAPAYSAMDIVKNFFLNCRSQAPYIALGAGVVVGGLLCIKSISALL